MSIESCNVADEEKTENVEETAVAADGAAETSDNSPSGDGAPTDDSARAESDEASSVESAEVDATPAGEAGGAETAEPAEVVHPRERRRARRSGKNRRAKFSGTPEEKAVQRAALRKKKAVQRRAFREKQRVEHKASGPREGTPATVREPGVKKMQQGTVVSDKNDKTIIVAIDVAEAHRVYKKIVRHTRKLTAHDPSNDANEGDVVRVIESRPLSRTKRWRLVEVLERAK